MNVKMVGYENFEDMEKELISILEQTGIDYKKDELNLTRLDKKSAFGQTVQYQVYANIVLEEGDIEDALKRVAIVAHKERMNIGVMIDIPTSAVVSICNTLSLEASVEDDGESIWYRYSDEKYWLYSEVDVCFDDEESDEFDDNGKQYFENINGIRYFLYEFMKV